MAKSLSCVNCHEPVGGESSVLPMHVADATEEGAGETWCPQCFAWKRAHLEPERFSGLIYAVKCASPSCGCTSVAFGFSTCPQCGSRQTVALPAKAGVVDAPNVTLAHDMPEARDA